MAFNGSGVFQRLYSWTNDALAGIKIRADRMDNEMNGMATGLSTCITKNGQTTITANLPMSGFKHTGAAVASARTDYAQAGQLVDGIINWAVAGGTADALTATYTIETTTVKDGQLFYVRAAAANTTTTPTFAPDGLTAGTIVTNGGDALRVAAWAEDSELVLRYNLANTEYELVSSSGEYTIPDGDYGDVTVSSNGSVVTVNNDAITTVKIDDDAVTADKIGTDASTIRDKIGLETLTYPLMDMGGAYFAGSNDYLDNNALTGIADGKKGTLFTLIKFDNLASGTEYIMWSTGARFRFFRLSTGVLMVECRNSTGTVIFDARTSVSVVGTDTYAVMISWDLATSGSTRFYVDEVAYNTPVTFTDDTIDYTVTEYTIGGDTVGGFDFTGNIYSFYFNSAEYIDFDIEANRRKFTDANGVPVFLGRNGELPTGTSPILFLGYNSGTDWVDNRGSATSTFTVNGTIDVPTVDLNGQYGDVEPIPPLKLVASVLFDGTGTPAITSQYNVASITDNGTGDYTINFTNALESADYYVVGTAGVTGGAIRLGVKLDTTPSTTAVRIQTRADSSNSDADYISVLIYQ
jgi:hypothetical protein